MASKREENDGERFVEAEAHPECVEWMVDHILDGLHLDRAMIEQGHLATITEFLLGDESKRSLFCMLSATGEETSVLVLQSGHPNQAIRRVHEGMNKDVLYFVLSEPSKDVTPENIDTAIIFGCCQNGVALDSFLRAMQHIYAPALLDNHNWPESIQKDFSSVTHRFMASLTEHANRAKGSTVFYVPLVTLTDDQWKHAHQDKELTQTFVTAVIHWTKQIREVVGERDVGAASESAGPLTEIEYWRARAVDLRNICDQFERADVKRIVDALAPAKDSKWSVEPFLNLKSDIEAGTEEAIDNLKYLRTLEEPCRRLAAAKPSEIPALIKPLLRTVQLVFRNSTHYRKHFFRLLRMISNEIVARCRQHINLQDIFDGKIDDAMVALQEAWVAGDAWMTQCRRMVNATVKYFRNKGEQIDVDESIYNEIDGFVKFRCSNLQEVCKGQLQFGFRMHPTEIPENGDIGYRDALPCFGGAKGPEIESQLLEIQRAFRSKMEFLRNLDYDILDVKATAWNDHYRQFKNELDDLGTMITQVIQSAFDLVATVEGGAELLEAFHFLAKRDKMQQAVDRRKDVVVAIFKKDLNFVQKQLGPETQKDKSVLWLHPPLAGQALRAKHFRQRIDSSHRLLHRLWYLSDSAEKQDAFEMFQRLDKNTLDESIKNKYKQWKESLPTDLTRFLDENVIMRKEAEFDVSLLAVNFPVALQEIFEEARYWSRLGEAVPPHILEMIAQYEEKLRVYRENVSVAVRAYNDIILALSAQERKLFARRIAHLDTPKVYAQGFTKQTWGSQGVVEYFVKECRIQADKVQTYVDRFTCGMQYIQHLCRVIADTLAISIEKKKVYKVDAFERQQAEHQKSIREKLVKAHNEIRDTLKGIFDTLRADYQQDTSIQQQWHSHIVGIEKMIAEALRTMVKKTLQEIARAVGTSKEEDKANLGQLFELEVHMVGTESPDSKPTPEAQPNIATLTQKIADIAKQALAVVNSLSLLEDSLKSVICADTEVETDEKLKALGPVKYDPPSDSHGYTSYFDLVGREGEILNLLQQIQTTVSSIGDKVKDQLRQRLESQKGDHEMWASKDQKLNRARKQWVLKDYESNILTYKQYDNNIMLWDPYVDVSFVRLDYTPMKQVLHRRCQFWQDEFLSLLHETSKQQLDSYYKKFDSNVEKLRKPPRSLDQLADHLTHSENFFVELPRIESDFDPLFMRYDVLASNSRMLGEKEQKQKNELRQAFETYKEDLTECKKQLDKHKEQFKQDLEAGLRQFNASCEQLKKDLLDNGPYSAGLSCNEARLKIADYSNRLQQRRDQEQALKQGMEMFKIDRPPHSDLKEVKDELDLLTQMWTLVEGWKNKSENWKKSPFKQLNPEEMNDGVDSDRKQVMLLRAKLERREVWSKLREEIDLFKKVLPVVEDLLIPAINDRHWRQLMVQLDEKFDPDKPEFCLEILLGFRIERQGEFISNLATAAKQELKIELDLDKIQETWEATDLEIQPYSTKGYFKIASVEDINNTLAEHIQLLSSMKMSRFVEAFKSRVHQWEQTLSIITDTLEALLIVQTKWMYLENIFVGGDETIRRKLAEETKLFESVNSQWIAIITRLHAEPKVAKGTRREGLLDQLNKMTADLEKIQKSLESFLEDSRRAFPRFYFLSNDDLLEILGHTKDPEKVQPHLRKCFEGLFKLEITKDKQGKKIAKAMVAADGEVVPFVSNVPIEGPGVQVEGWLRNVEAMMKTTVNRALFVTLDRLQTEVNFPKSKIDKDKLFEWLRTNVGMCTITAACINWTKETERVLFEYSGLGGGGRRKRTPVYRMYKKWKILIKRYCEIVRRPLEKLVRNKLVALITIEVHSRDILNALQAERVSDPLSFDWSKQLRFYKENIDGADICTVKQTSSVVRYDLEYLGNSGRLVVTSLTDRAYMTLTTALQLHRGGLPQGPAGTGKTETVKDLGKAIAKYVMVFNCSDGLDYKSLGRMFSGLAQTGAWSCFDEFNRIEVEVLSVVAQQIFSILSAVGEQKKRFLFEGVEIPLNLNCGIFVTMNPGYAGRSELPDNLKALLRPISMMVPDFALICEITLLSQGFAESKLLALRVSILYELMEKQLSKQDHYDFSLRNIKAVLVQAGNLMRQSTENKDKRPSDVSDKVREQQLCVKACKDMNLPKFVKDDVPLFLSMLSDLFPGVEPGDAGLEKLREESLNELESRGFHRNDHIALKVLHFWDTLNTRHGVMVVGRSGSGKTVTWQTLSGALKRLKAKNYESYESVKVNLINPKSVTMDELYGSYNMQTREWKDGILSDMMRTICRDETLVLKWLLFDGPVDTLWIESMNTVLDDNKMLTLNSGERINLTPQVSMVFEVEDLSQASPATVSRCGMVYFNVEDLGWQPYVYTWLKSRYNFEISINAPKPENTVKDIQAFIDQTMSAALAFRARECVELFSTSEINAVRSFTHLLDAVANPDAMIFTPNCALFNPQAAGEQYLNIIRQLCLFSLMWSVGATLVEDSRRKFDVFMRELEGTMPSTDTAFEYFPDYRTQTWKPWEEHPAIQRPFTAEDGAPYYSLLVPTIDTVRYHCIVTQLVRSKVHCVLVGNTGTGKTLVAQQVLKTLPMESYSAIQLNFSAQTSSKNVQDIIEGKMEHPSKKACHPPGGRRMVCLVEDLNMPAKEKFGAQPPLELLRQWMDNGFWYDRATQSRRNVNEMQLLCNMTFGRPDISQRLLSKLNVLNITFPSDNVISKIFTSILTLRFQRLDADFFVNSTDSLVKATMQVYAKVTTELLPIPTKSHYLYNLRDLSKVFQGIYSACLEAMDTKEQLITLWMHEAFRTFSDRMNDPKDKQWFRELVVEKLASIFQTKWTTLLKDGRNPIFVDFWEGDFDELAKYKLVPSMADLKKKLEDNLETFNNEGGGRGMNLVFFADAMEHLCRIHRIIRQPRGNALLVGLGGSGRTSLTRLAAYLAGYSVFSIEIHKKYDVDRFHDDLRTLFKVCGGPKKQQRVFYFTDNQIMHTTFLEDLNNMLSVGEVPNLFPKDDIALIRDDLRKEALENGIRDTLDDIYNFFIDRARRNLHLVISMSPAHKDFRTRLRQFPGLVSCTTIDWFIEWPTEALKEVGMRCLREPNILEEDKIETVSDVFCLMHDTTNQAAQRLKLTLKRYTYVTPSSYLDLVRGYISMFQNKREELLEYRDKLKNGMSKLEDTKEMVGKMGAELKIKEEALRVKTAEVDQAMQLIQHQQQLADEQQTVLATEKVKIEREKQLAEAIAGEAKVELDKAMPALDAATEALNSLDKRELQELKTFARPPDLVRLVMQGVQTALRKGTEWDDAKKSLNETGFIDRLKEYDKNNMSDKLLAQLEKFVTMPTFNVELAKKVSNAVAGLCQWVIAIHKYGLVYKEVAPKQQKLAAAMARVAHQEEQLRLKEEKLAEVLAKVKQLQDDLKSNLEEKKALQAAALETEQKMKRAQIIVSGLEGERDLWTQQIEYFETCLTNLVGDVALASGYLSYVGAFPAEYREDLMKIWGKEVRKALPVTRSFDFVSFLVAPTEVRDWQNDGLPGDDFSCENGVMVTRGSRWPLMVDPQGQANKWIKKMQKENGLKVIDPKQSDYIKTIEYAVQFGTPVLLQDILEDIDPAIDTVVSKAVIRKGNKATIKIGDNFIEYNDSFRLFITTKLANPHYSPEICTKVCLLNFAVKEQGLEEQLLKIVVEKEKPELEEQNEKLILNSAAAEKEKKRLEDEILNLLAQSDDSLLDNVKLVETLQTSKQTQIQIKQQLEQAAKTKQEIAAARDQYRECAKRASILFFVLADLGSIDNMYQFALDSYIVLFQISIKRSAEKIRVDSVAERVTVLNDWHTGAVYSNTCRGLFEKHKLLFSFHMTARILMGRGELNMEEYAFFIKGGVVLDKESQTPNPAPGWLSAAAWDNICELDKLLNFHGVASSFEGVPQDWYAWFLNEKPEEALMPAEWQAKTQDNYLQRMVIVRCVRPDRIIFMVQKYIEDMLDRRYIEPPPFSLLDTFDESKNILPLVFVLSPGVDPNSQLVALAEKKGRNLRSLALGQGQDVNATKLINDNAQSGGWVFLANCHLMVSWLQELEKIIDNLPNLRPHENFRLWLSSTPTPAFPIGILQRAIKMTTEPPNGIKANMLRLYHAMSEEHFLSNSGERPQLYRPLLFALCYFHAVLLERRKFGTLGYNVVYDFTTSDFEVSDNIIALYVRDMPDSRVESVPFTTIRYLIAEASYGGRVTDDWDRRVINTYMDHFMCTATVATEGYRLSTADYFVPPDAPPLQSYKEFCGKLPTNDAPEAFGQHPNADIASQIANSMALLDNLMSTNATLVRSGGGGSSDSKASSIEDRCLSILSTLDEQVPGLIDFDTILEQTVDERGTALNTCLLQEIQRYNALLKKVHRQKADLRRAVKGELVMNDELDTIFNALLVNKVPPPWMSGYPSSKPLASWTRDLIERVDQMIQWGRATPKVFWLTGFTYPTGFLKSLQQQQARKENVPIDEYGWEFFVLPSEDKTIMHSAKEGAYVRGIWLEGAGWDPENNVLCEPNPMELIVPMPIIHFRPKRREGKTKMKGIYSCPMYMYPVRTGTRERPSFVLAVDLASGQAEPDVWTKRGTALLLATAD